MNKKIIYDFGSNNGDDIPYYLLKSDLVVAVEANPLLCEQISNRFASEIERGKLVIENCVITAEDSKQVSFYISNKHNVLSQFPKPSTEELCHFSEVILPSKKAAHIINEHGAPYYIKIDIEHYDAEILRALSKGNIFPPFISAESHSIDVFCMLVNMGYRAFKLVDGLTVSEVYANRSIPSAKGGKYSFPHHSAGPFGNDVDGNWMTADNFFRLLAFEGLGWKDIHASLHELPDPSISPSLQEKCKRETIKKIKRSYQRIFRLIKFA